MAGMDELKFWVWGDSCANVKDERTEVDFQPVVCDWLVDV